MRVVNRGVTICLFFKFGFFAVGGFLTGLD